MADQKISELTPTTPQDADALPIERAAATNWSVSFSALRTWFTQFFADETTTAAHITDTDIHFADVPGATLSGRVQGAWVEILHWQGANFIFSHDLDVGSDPGAGVVKLNNSGLGLSTIMVVSDVTSDTYDVRTHFLNIQPQTEIRLVDDVDPTKSVVYVVPTRPTGHTGYVEIPLTWVSTQGGGRPEEGARIHVFAPVGGVWDQLLSAVADDTTPQLGGDLETKGSAISLTRADDSLHGFVEALTAIDGSALFYSDDGTYVSGDGAFLVRAGLAEIDGIVNVPSLKHSDSAGHQVYVTENGVLYGVSPPDPGWSAPASDTGLHDLGNGTGAGTWVKVTNLEINPGADIASGDRIDWTYQLWALNKTTNRTGSVEVDIGINGAPPVGPPTESNGIAAGFVGYISAAGFFLAAQAYTTADTFALWARINNGNNAAFGVELSGVVNQHEMVMSTPGASSGTGDVTGPAGATSGNVATYADASGKVIADGGPLPTTAIMTGRDTYAIAGTVSDGDTLEFFVLEDTGGGGEVVEVIGCTAKIATGTCSITVDVGGTPVPGLDGPIAVSATPVKTDASGNGVRPGGSTIPANVTVSSAAGSDLSVTIFTRHTITLG